MGLARSTYYRLKNESKAKLREQRDLEVKDLIDNIHVEFPVYGCRNLHKEILRRGILINEKKYAGFSPNLDFSQHKFVSGL